MTNKNIIMGLSVLLIAAASSLAAIVVMNDPPASRPGSTEATYIMARSIEELVEKSGIIAIGTVKTGSPGSRQIQGRSPLNPAEPDPNFIGIGRIYQIEVERFLKGTGDATLPIVQIEGHITKLQGVSTEVRRKDAEFPLKTGTRYLVFLRPHGQAPDLLTGTAQPFRFELSIRPGIV